MFIRFFAIALVALVFSQLSLTVSADEPDVIIVIEEIITTSTGDGTSNSVHEEKITAIDNVSASSEVIEEAIKVIDIVSPLSEIAVEPITLIDYSTVSVPDPPTPTSVPTMVPTSTSAFLFSPFFFPVRHLRFFLVISIKWIDDNAPNP